jgi:hypothetical protein
VLKKGTSTVLILQVAFNTLRKDGFFPLVLSLPAGSGSWGLRPTRAGMKMAQLRDLSNREHW